MIHNARPFWLFILLTLLLFSALAGCSPSDSNRAHPLEMAPLEAMPAEVQSAPLTVREAYQFAAANAEVLTQIPCYCGCGAMGHTSNYACYFAGENPDGSLAFDPHALGCSICVDITQDTMRLLQQGQSVAEIRASIDETYARYGPSNMP